MKKTQKKTTKIVKNAKIGQEKTNYWAPQKVETWEDAKKVWAGRNFVIIATQGI